MSAASVDFIYLASRSPRRRELLAQLGVVSRPLVSDADEDDEALEAVLPHESPRRYVERVTRLKANAAVVRLAARGLEPAPILVGDTTVALRGEILGKPLDPTDATRMLDALQGRLHHVLTSVAMTDGRRTMIALSDSRVRMRRVTRDEIDRYVGSGEPFGKAGAYAIQGLASSFVSFISGSHSGIVGLPLYETAALLRAHGFHCP